MQTNLDELDKLNYCLWLSYFELKSHLQKKKLKLICIVSFMTDGGISPLGKCGPSNMGEENRTLKR